MNLVDGLERSLGPIYLIDNEDYSIGLNVDNIAAD